MLGAYPPDYAKLKAFSFVRCGRFSNFAIVMGVTVTRVAIKEEMKFYNRQKELELF